MTEDEKTELENRVKELEALVASVEKQRDAALKLLNRRNQELFNDHALGVG